MKDVLRDAVRRRWEHFTSWWVYPATAFLSVTLIALLILGVGGDIVLIALRLMLFLASAAFIYDLRWRKPRARKARRRQESRRRRQRTG